MQLVSTLLLLICFVRDSEGISLEAVLVPQYKFRGQNATLLCKYDLPKDGSEELYSLKWYFKDEEFYRFTPQSPYEMWGGDNYNIQRRNDRNKEYWEQQQKLLKFGGEVRTWNVRGIRIDEENSVPEKVVLK